MSMTKTQLLQYVHRTYINDTNYPSSSDDDYLLRVDFADMAINVWGAESGIEWNELVDRAYSETLVNATATYNLPADFVYPIGYVRLYQDGTPTLIPLIRAEREHLHEAADSSEKRAWITGTQGAYVLNIAPTPTTDNGMAGQTVKLDHYREPALLSALGDSAKLEMPDPWFVYHFVLGKLYSADEDFTQATYHNQLAQQKLQDMRVKNQAVPIGQDNTAPDVYGGLGA